MEPGESLRPLVDEVLHDINRGSHMFKWWQFVNWTNKGDIIIARLDFYEGDATPHKLRIALHVAENVSRQFTEKLKRDLRKIIRKNKLKEKYI